MCIRDSIPTGQPFLDLPEWMTEDRPSHPRTRSAVTPFARSDTLTRSLMVGRCVGIYNVRSVLLPERILMHLPLVKSGFFAPTASCRLSSRQVTFEETHCKNGGV